MPSVNGFHYLYGSSPASLVDGNGSRMKTAKPRVDIIRATRRMPDGRVGIVERPVETRGRLGKTDARAQAAAMLVKRLFDADRPTIAELGEEFGLSERTASARLQIARQDGVPDEVRVIAIREMLPASLAVIQEVLQGDDLKLAAQTAWKVIDSLKAIELPERERQPGEVEETLEAWRMKITRTSDAPAVDVVDVTPKELESGR